MPMMLRRARERHCLHYVLNDRKAVVAECYGQDDATVQAHADLFAAGPDLRAALQHALDLIDQSDTRQYFAVRGDMSECSAFITNARAALAKAEGGAA